MPQKVRPMNALGELGRGLGELAVHHYDLGRAELAQDLSHLAADAVGAVLVTTGATLGVPFLELAVATVLAPLVGSWLACLALGIANLAGAAVGTVVLAGRLRHRRVLVATRRQLAGSIQELFMAAVGPLPSTAAE